jgi:hypothetical protein
LAHKLASSASCIHGVRTCCFILISTALYLLADSHWLPRMGSSQVRILLARGCAQYCVSGQVR